MDRAEERERSWRRERRPILRTRRDHAAVERTVACRSGVWCDAVVHEVDRTACGHSDLGRTEREVDHLDVAGPRRDGCLDDGWGRWSAVDAGDEDGALHVGMDDAEVGERSRLGE